MYVPYAIKLCHVHVSKSKDNFVKWIIEFQGSKDQTQVSRFVWQVPFLTEHLTSLENSLEGEFCVHAL